MSSMMKIAWRNTRRQFRRSALLGGAIAFGVFIITLINGFTAGLTDSIKHNLVYVFGGHVYILGSQLTETGREVGLIDDGTVLEQIIADSGLPIESVHRRSQATAMIIFGSRQVAETIEGVDFTLEPDFLRSLPLKEGDVAAAEHEIAPLFLTGLAAEVLGVQVGETVLARLTTVTGQVNVGEFVVVGVIEDSTSMGMASAYTERAYLNSLIGLEPQQYQTVNLVFHDMRGVDEGARQLIEQGSAAGLNIDMLTIETETSGLSVMIGPDAGEEEVWEGTKYEVMTINQLVEPIQSAFVVLDSIGLGIFLVLLLITMVGIMNTFRMILIERTREIGTMRAFGMQRNVVRRIFLWEAAFIALGGGVVGIFLAVVGAALLSRLSLAAYPELGLFTTKGYLVFHITPGALVTNVVLLLVMSLLAALLPANAAAKMEPAKALGTYF